MNNFKMVQHLADATTSTTMDSSAYGYDGTKSAANNPVETDGQIYKAQDFSDDIIDFGDIDEIDGIAKFTVACWIKADSLQAGFYPYIFSKEFGVDGKNRILISGLRDVSGTGRFLISVGQGDNFFGYEDHADFTIGAWHHVAVVFDGTGATDADKLKLYFDGELRTLTYGGTAPATTDSNVATVCIGEQEGESNPFDGEIDEVCVVATDWSAAEVKVDYNSGNNSLLTYGNEEYLLKPSSITSSEAFGTAHLLTPLKPSSIVSSEAFGTPQLGPSILPPSIPSAEAFGTCHIRVEVNPQDHEGSVGWTDEENAYDEDTGTYAYDDIPAESWSDWLTVNRDLASTCSMIRVWYDREDSDIGEPAIEIHRDGAWVEV